MPRLEEVFKLSGVPTHTFVEPTEYNKLRIALRTPGRGVIIEGPSGIGKTTAVGSALRELGLEGTVVRLSARKAQDRDSIAAIPTVVDGGVVIIDDFHRLSMDVRNEIGDFLKTLADEEREDTKVVVVGINRTGETLVRSAPDLTSRIDVIRFEVNPDDKVQELLKKGEEALNLSFASRDDLVQRSAGSFYLAQMLAHETCLADDVTESLGVQRIVGGSVELVVERVMDALAREFMSVAAKFAAGPKLRRAGRAPYLHVLRWLSEADEWSLSLDREISKHAEHRSSVGQIVDKGYLGSFVAAHNEFSAILHFEPSTHVLTVEDPRFVFFLRNLLWAKFADRVGYVNVVFPHRYDFALSFAGSQRTVAERLRDLLQDEEIAVFYDKDEQHRILAADIEEYLKPIYKTEAAYVVCLLSADYPKRIWTKFESDQFRLRFGEKAVIPIWYADVPVGVFDETGRVGGYSYDPSKPMDLQLQELADLLNRKVLERRAET